MPTETHSQDVMTVHFVLGLGHYKLSLYESAMLHFLKAESIANEEGNPANILK